MQPVLVLRKVRDFGERISDTLLFLKYNWKSLFLLYAVFVIPFLLVGAIFGASSIGSFFTKATLGSPTNALQFFSGELFLAIFLLGLATVSYITVVFCYMRLYEEKGGQAPTISEVGNIFTRKFFSNLGYALIILLIFCVGVFAVVIPILGVLAYIVGAIYFAVCVSVLFPANTCEDVSFANAFGRCFHLIKNRWWFTFGYIIILSIIFSFFSYVIQTIVMVIFGISSINFIDPERATDNFAKKFIYVFGLVTIIQQVFYLLVHVGTGIHYYSLREEKDGSGLEQRLDQLGGGAGPHSSIEEQY